MTYKAGDLVYFDDGVQKGVGKIVSVHKYFTSHYPVHSTQLKRECNGMLLNSDWWWFIKDDLKPFTKKVGQKYKVLMDSSFNFRVGDIVTLHHIDDDCVSYYKKDSVENYMFDIDHENCELEFYADVEDTERCKENEMFTKEDLKVGYLVKLRSGKLAHVVNTENHGLCFNYEKGRDTFNSFNNDLTSKSLSAYDVVEVYGYTRCGLNAHEFEIGNRKLLWKREEVKEMTIEDIQKVLGHKIKVVE